MASWSVVGARLTEEAVGEYRARAGRSFGCAQDDETGVAVEAVGVHRASTGRSFGCAQDDETGPAVEAVGVHRAAAV